MPVIENAIVPQTCNIAGDVSIVGRGERKAKLERGVELEAGVQLLGSLHIADYTTVGASTTLTGEIRVGRNCQIGKNVTIKGTVTISDRTQIEDNCVIEGTVSIGKDCAIGRSVAISSHVNPVASTHPADRTKSLMSEGYIRLGNRCTIRSNSTVSGTVRIGHGSIIQPGITVAESINDDTFRWGTSATSASSFVTSAADPVSVAAAGGHGEHAPFRQVAGPESVSTSLGVHRYASRLENGQILDWMCVNKNSDVLVVALHGAIGRADFDLPKFEWYRTLSSLNASSLFFGDPGLYEDPEISLGWYLGTYGYDLHKVLAQWTESIAKRIGASRIVFTGLSGGGFAALQISKFIKDSHCAVFDPRVDIPKFTPVGGVWWPFHKFVATCMPEIAPAKALPELYGSEWGSEVEHRFLASKAYSIPRGNHVIYCANDNDPYSNTELPIFLKRLHPNNSVRVVRYQGADRHGQPPQGLIKDLFEKFVR